MKDDVEALRIMMDVKFRDVIIVKVGEVFKINVDIVGRFLSVIFWVKDGVEIEERVKIEIVLIDYIIILIVKDCVRRDIG